MKKLYLLFSIAIAVFLTACNSGSEIPPVNTEEEGEEFINVTASVTLPDSKSTKAVGLPEDPILGDDGKFWYEYQWDENKVQTLHVYFKGGGKTGKSTATFTVPTGYHPTKNPKPISIKIPIPTGFETLDNYTITGAFGVNGMDNNGICNIDPPTVINGNNEDYELPFYFPPTVVKNKNCQIQFNTYGSLIRVVINGNEDINTEVSFSELKIKTSVFSIKGKFDIKTATATAAPTWTKTVMGSNETVVTGSTYNPSFPGVAGTLKYNDFYKYTSLHTYTLHNVKTQPAVGTTPPTNAVVYVWGYPDPEIKSIDEETVNSFNDYQRAIYFSVHAPSRWFDYSVFTKNKWDQKKTYTINAFYTRGSLIFSELLYVQATASIFELYNISDTEIIDLRNYKLYDPQRRATVYFKDNNVMLKDYNVPADQGDALKLKPHQVLVIEGTGATDFLEGLGALYGKWGRKFWHNQTLGWFKHIQVNYRYQREVWFGHTATNNTYYILYADPDTGTNMIIDTIKAKSMGHGCKRNLDNNVPNPIYNSNGWAWYTIIGWMDDNYSNADFGVR